MERENIGVGCRESCVAVEKVNACFRFQRNYIRLMGTPQYPSTKRVYRNVLNL